MSPIESGEKSPEINVKQLEEKLLRDLGFLKEKMPDCPHKGEKDFLRFTFLRETEALGVSREEALQMFPYFLRLTYEDHKEADRMWEHFEKLSRYAKNPVSANQIATEILETTTGGITPMWHLVEKIIKGEFVVEKKEATEGKVYSIRKQSDTEEYVNTPERKQAIESIKEKFNELIKQEPSFEPDEGVQKMSEHDDYLFFKIPHFMHEDAEIIVNCEEWHPLIDEYFDGVKNHLSAALNILNIESSKSNARKARFKRFIDYIFKSYLEKLMGYCKNLTKDKNEKNQFASDIIFESHLSSENILSQDNKKTDYKAIEGKWQRLFIELRKHVQDQATLYMIAVDTQSMVAPPVSAAPVAPEAQSTPEVVTQTVRARSSSALNKTMLGIPAMQEKPELPVRHIVGLGEAATAEEREKIGKADTMIAIINQEFGKFPTQPIKMQDEKGLQSSAMLSYPYIAVVPGSQAEQELLNLVNRDVDNLFVQNEEKLKSTGNNENFIWQLKKIAKTKLSTQGLMSAFFSRVIARYEDLVEKCNEQEKNNVFDNVSGVFNAIGHGSLMPNTITKNLKGENDIKMDIPRASNLDSILTGIPSIESSEFGNLKEFLVKKGLYERFLEIESELKEQLLGNDVKDFGVFIELNKRLSIAVSNEEAFIYYYKGEKAVIDSALKDIKGLIGNWFTKHFKFGRSAEVKEEMEKYLSQLQDSACETWERAVKPTISQYGKIIFGADLYGQKTSQNRTK